MQNFKAAAMGVVAAIDFLVKHGQPSHVIAHAGEAIGFRTRGHFCQLIF
jgi:hypothetical protein